jgi:hypothetical protein
MMATVTGLTAERMLAIEGASVVGGEVNGSGHLILETHDGSLIDAGSVIGDVPEQDVVKYLDPAEFVQATLPANYPMGVSLLYLTSTDATAGGWTDFLTKWGTVRTIKPTAGEDIAQIWMHHADETVEPELWIRNGNWSGWGVWRRLTTTVDTNALDARIDALEVAGKTVQLLADNAHLESAPIGDYPLGVSMMTLTTSSGWTFNSGFGLIVTYRMSDSRNRQIFYGHTAPEDRWERVSHSTIPGWSAWKRVVSFSDSNVAWNSFTPGWTSSTPPSIGNGTRAGFYKQLGKIVHFKAVITFGSTTTYGTGAWAFPLPVTPHANAEGFVASFLGIQGANRAVGLGSYQSADGGLVVYASAGSTLWQSGSPLTWANTGILRYSGTYEAA